MENAGGEGGKGGKIVWRMWKGLGEVRKDSRAVRRAERAG